MEPDMQMAAVWNASHQINSFEVDPAAKATLQTLCKLMQEAAWDHAEALGLGYARMVERDLIWVLARLKIKVHRFPAWGDRIRLKTWPTGVQRLFAFREFQIFDENNSLIVEAKGAWLILEGRSRRPIRVGPLFEQVGIPAGKGLFNEDLEKLPSPGGHPMEPSFPVRYSDLDWHHHVNHVQFIEWILDSYPLQMHADFEVSSLEMNFLSETHHGDEISVCTQQCNDSPPSFLHSLLRGKDGQEICTAIIHWRERNEGNGG